MALSLLNCVSEIEPTNSQRNAERVFLTFRGINYRAKISLGNRNLSNSSDLSGMFITRRIEITSELRLQTANEAQDSLLLRVEVFPPDHVGIPKHLTAKIRMK